MLPKNVIIIERYGGIAQLARALALQARGQEFESLYLHHIGEMQISPLCLILSFAKSLHTLWPSPFLPQNIQKHSSAGQSAALIRLRSVVQVHLLLPKKQGSCETTFFVAKNLFATLWHKIASKRVQKYMYTCKIYFFQKVCKFILQIFFDMI